MCNEKTCSQSTSLSELHVAFFWGIFVYVFCVSASSASKRLAFAQNGLALMESLSYRLAELGLSPRDAVLACNVHGMSRLQENIHRGPCSGQFVHAHRGAQTAPSALSAVAPRRMDNSILRQQGAG